VQNLLSNAVKYGAGTVNVVARDEGAHVALDVTNRGSVIPESALLAIFEPLRTSDQTAGLGLGLYIVREIVSAHGGVVTVRSSEQEGTTFTVRLPRHPPSEHPFSQRELTTP
jgi:sigma-B regulation protein RsbU (phosphoserine phosphatase)